MGSLRVTRCRPMRERGRCGRRRVRGGGGRGGGVLDQCVPQRRPVGGRPEGRPLARLDVVGSGVVAVAILGRSRERRQGRFRRGGHVQHVVVILGHLGGRPSDRLNWQADDVAILGHPHQQPPERHPLPAPVIRFSCDSRWPRRATTRWKPLRQKPTHFGCHPRSPKRATASASSASPSSSA